LAERAVVDAGPLIWLAQCGLLSILRRSYSSVSMPPAVRHEVIDRGIEGGHSDAAIISDALDEGWIKVETPSKSHTKQTSDQAARTRVRLGGGETQAIALALAEKAVLLTNDEDARTVARLLGLRTAGVPRILINAVKLGHLTKEEARSALGRMIDEGLWLSPAVVQLFNELLEGI